GSAGAHLSLGLAPPALPHAALTARAAVLHGDLATRAEQSLDAGRVEEHLGRHYRAEHREHRPSPLSAPTRPVVGLVRSFSRLRPVTSANPQESGLRW